MATNENVSSTENILTDSFLRLEEIDTNLYRSQELFRPAFARAVYGGQVVAHALRAAYNTTPSEHKIHSLHCYFLKGASTATPILYYVDHTREGKTYCNRNVKALQDGAAVFTMQASFKRNETSELFHHQYTMPDVPGPEGLLSRIEILERLLSESSPDGQRSVYLTTMLSEVTTYESRPIKEAQVLRSESLEPRAYTWIRALGHIGDDPIMHDCIAVYMSDTIITVSILPAGMFNSRNKTRFFMASLDHSVWFHNPIRVDEWLLFETESPQCGNGRAMTLGRLWRRDGTLAMSIAQEGVVRTFQSNL